MMVLKLDYAEKEAGEETEKEAQAETEETKAEKEETKAEKEGLLKKLLGLRIPSNRPTPGTGCDLGIRKVKGFVDFQNLSDP